VLGGLQSTLSSTAVEEVDRVRKYTKPVAKKVTVDTMLALMA
jgi:hypothetical protein